MAQQPEQQGYAPRHNNYQSRQERPRRHIDPVSMLYAQLLRHLLDLRLVELRTMGPPIKLPASYDVNAKCDFHSGAAGHDIERCYTFKNKFQDLIEREPLTSHPRGLIFSKIPCRYMGMLPCRLFSIMRG